MSADPTELMDRGAKHLKASLHPLGFVFRVVGSGESSGGPYCAAEFCYEDRRIELHYRHGLGMVRYHIGNASVSHESYVESLGVRDQCRYPGFYDDKMEGFRCLAHDLTLIINDFVNGNGRYHSRAAAAEKRKTNLASHELMVDAVGDNRARSQARVAFREKRYAEVVRLLTSLQYPDDLSRAESKMLEIARGKDDG